MKTSSIIMAGGNGTRFWPKSRTSLPKQFLDLDGTGTLINKTILRLADTVEMDSLYIVGNKKHKGIFDKQLPETFLRENLLLEPSARNTAPAIGASVMALHKKYGNHVVVVLPSDQHIKKEENFTVQLQKAIQLAKSSHCVVTLGIKPTYPATGYGYLDTKKISQDIYALSSFVEKPTYEKALEYTDKDNFYWNAGIFVFESGVMLDHLKNHMPALFSQCEKIEDWNKDLESGRLEKLYNNMPSESIDYGIMEKIDNILMVPLDCGWSDLGSWDALNTVKKENSDENILEGNVQALNTKGATIIGHKKLIAAIGLKDIIVVDTEDALLICHKDDVQEIKTMVNTLKETGQSALV